MATRKTAKEKSLAPDGAGDQVVLNMRLPREMCEAVDAWMEKLNAGHVGPQWSRTSIMRVTLARALKERGAKGMEP